ncbi:hypothetical protein GCM10027048_23600 [Hymenobacter coalescens]
MKKLLLLAGLAGLYCGPVQAQTTPGNTAVVRVRESGGWNNVVVSYGPGKTEMMELIAVPNKKEQVSNAERLQVVFDKLFAAGYVLQGSFSGAEDDNNTSTLIFRKP